MSVGSGGVVEVEDVVLVLNVVDAAELASGAMDEEVSSGTLVELGINEDSIEELTDGEVELGTEISVDDATTEGFNEDSRTSVDESSGATVELVNEDDSAEAATVVEKTELISGRSEEDAMAEENIEPASTKTEDVGLSEISVELAGDGSMDDGSSGTTVELTNADEKTDDASGSTVELAIEDESMVEASETVLSATTVLEAKTVSMVDSATAVEKMDELSRTIVELGTKTDSDALRLEMTDVNAGSVEGAELATDSTLDGSAEVDATSIDDTMELAATLDSNTEDDNKVSDADSEVSIAELPTEELDSSVKIEVGNVEVSRTDVDWMKLDTSLLETAELKANVDSKLENVETSMTEVTTSTDVTEEATGVTNADGSTVELMTSEMVDELIYTDDSNSEDSCAEVAAAELSGAELVGMISVDSEGEAEDSEKAALVDDGTASELLSTTDEPTEFGSILNALLRDKLDATEAKEL